MYQKVDSLTQTFDMCQLLNIFFTLKKLLVLA